MLENTVAAGYVAAGGSFTGVGASVALAGTGLYDVTLAQGVPETGGTVLATPIGTAGAEIAIFHTSDTVKRIKTFNASGTATSMAFSFRIATIST